MAPLVAILTLAASPALAAEPGPLAMEYVEALEHVPLPAACGPLTVQVRAFQSTVVLVTSRAAAVAAAVGRAPRAVCAGVQELPGEVRLHCRSTHLVARLLRRGDARLLEIAETRGLPWGDDGPPLAPFEPISAGLGKPCPGSTAAGRAECLLATGHPGGAATELAVARLDPEPDFAYLRLGDLAFAAGDARRAAALWDRVHAEPWERLAAVRRCELSRACLADSKPESLYSTAGLPQTVAREVALRRARALAFGGDPIAAARLLLTGEPGVTACSAAPALCQRLALAALTAPGPAAMDSLLLWLQLPDRGRGPVALESEVAVASVAERLGAPLFAANVLSGAAGRVPAHALVEHLLHAAELYLAGGDDVRAGVVAEFARQRAGKRGLPGPRWAAVQRALAGTRRAAAAPAAPPIKPDADLGDLLAAVDRKLQAARRLTQGDNP